MPAKAKAKKKAKKAVKPAKKVAAKAKKGQALECHVCGYRVVVDEACGCEEEHVLYCCGQPMEKV
jgi:transcription initiation factor IIE alpha subunit